MDESPKPPRRFRRWLLIPLAVIVLVIAGIVIFGPALIKPIVEARASAALGRKVTIAQLHFQFGRIIRIVADDIEVANPDGFPPDSRFASIERLGVDIDALGYLRTWALVIPAIDVTRPVVAVASTPAGVDNYKFPAGSSSGGASPQIGAVNIEDGHATVKIPKMKADFALDIATRTPQGKDPQIVVGAKGTYAGQPITGTFVGGALLSLRDAGKPYPIDLHLTNGPTRVAIVGTVQDPLAFKGTDVKLELAGSDMANLYPLTGVPIPQTPPYKMSGELAYAGRRIRFDHFAGTVGHSDLNGSIAVDPGRERPLVEADLTSRQIDLNDLGGFIGATPGDASTAQTAEQKQAQARAAASANLLPDTPINMPKLKSADFKVKYRGQHIEGRSMPLDDLNVYLTITDGDIALQPIAFGVGKGRIDGNVALDEQNEVLHTKATVNFQKVDLARVMASTHIFGGAGTIGGRVELTTTGNSMAKMMANGDGSLKLFMTGGDLSALLVDLAGLDFGNAVLSALGIPNRAPIRCMIADMPMQKGILNTRTLLLDTTEANVTGTGQVDFRNQTIDYQLKSDPKHFSVGALPAPIDIRGRLKSPSVLPDPAAVGARAGAAAVLGVLLTPLAALIPTIQLGLGEDNDCAALLTNAAQSGANKLTPSQVRDRVGK